MSGSRTISLRDEIGQASLIGFSFARSGEDGSALSVKPAFVGVANNLSISVLRTPSGMPAVGDTISYTVQVQCQTPNSFSNIVVEDMLPSNLTYVSSSSPSGTYDPMTGRWTSSTGFSLGNFGSTTFTVQALVNAPGTITNTATLISSDPADQFAFDNSSTDTTTAVCFASGTRIRTPAGDVVVEHLSVGDLVTTTSGAARPVRWLGHRVTRCASHPEPRRVWPIRIARDAFGPGLPACDLRVSPDHMICVDLLGEALIPAKALVNGTTIVQEPVDTITYWHVELDSHDILLAEGLPAESYIDMGNRAFFAESGVVDLAALPGGKADHGYAGYCRPVHDSGPMVAFVAERLARQAERLEAAAGLRLADAA